MDEWINKLQYITNIYLYVYIHIFFGHKREGNPAISDMYEPREHQAK
jgi:hypothetical protein